MNRLHPVWPSWALLAAAVLVFFGERVFPDAGGVRLAFDGLAAALMLAAVVSRFDLFRRAPDDRRPVASALFFATLGVVAAFAGYALIPLGASGPPATIIWGLAPVALAVFAFPLAALEIAVAPVAMNPAYERLRVRHALRRGVGLGLALSVLFLVNLLASRHDQKWDLSAGSSAAPSDATVRAVRDLTKDVTVTLFFPRANEVADTVERYFEPLTKLNPRLTVERKDHALALAAAKETGVTENGWVALQHDGKSSKFRIGEQARAARSALRRLDKSALKSLVEVTTRKRVAYFTVGHGERAYKTPDRDDRRTPITLLKEQLEAWQFEVKPLGVSDGLAERLPDDNSVVLIIGPSQPFLPAEIETLKVAMGRGARLLIALEAGLDEQPLAGLLEALGIAFSGVPLAHERVFAPVTRTQRDRSFLATNRFSSHPSVTTMSRNNQLAVVLDGPGALTRLPAGPSVPRASLEFVMTAADETFEDRDGDRTRAPEEPADSFSLAAAISRTSTGSATAEARAFVLGDADVFADTLAKLVQGNLYLLRDIIYWLQVDEDPIIPTVTERDVKIVHKAETDALLFYGTSFGAPLLVLGLGALATRRRRR